MQACFQISLQFPGGLPILTHQRLENGPWAAALAVEQDLVGKFPQAVGNQPLEIHAALRPSQPHRQVFHRAMQPKTPLDYDVRNAVEFLESQVENGKDSRSKIYKAAE